MAAQLENVAKSFCREQSRDGTFPLDDRIRHQGRRMGDPAGRLDMTNAIRIEGTRTRLLSHKKAGVTITITITAKLTQISRHVENVIQNATKIGISASPAG